MKKFLSYSEFIDLAMKHYAKGGDEYVECWDERMFDDYVAEFGPISKKKALGMFRDSYAIDCEYRAAASFFGGY